MNKLYSQSMCSVKQWRAYQNAEAMVSQEVEEVRAEADEIEPGWSQVRCPRVLAACALLPLRMSHKRCTGYLATSNAISSDAETEARTGGKGVG